jgi:hypothetical protein
MTQEDLDKIKEELLTKFDEETTSRVIQEISKETLNSNKTFGDEKYKDELKKQELEDKLKEEDLQRVIQHTKDFKIKTVYTKEDAEFSARKIKALENLRYSTYEEDHQLLVKEFLADDTLTIEQLRQILECRNRGIVFIISDDLTICYAFIKAILDYDDVILRPQEITKLQFMYEEEVAGNDISELQYRITADTRIDLTDKESIMQEYEMFKGKINISAFVFLDSDDGENYKVVNITEK